MSHRCSKIGTNVTKKAPAWCNIHKGGQSRRSHDPRRRWLRLPEEHLRGHRRRAACHFPVMWIKLGMLPLQDASSVCIFTAALVECCEVRPGKTDRHRAMVVESSARYHGIGQRPTPVLRRRTRPRLGDRAAGPTPHSDTPVGLSLASASVERRTRLAEAHVIEFRMRGAERQVSMYAQAFQTVGPRRLSPIRPVLLGAGTASGPGDRRHTGRRSGVKVVHGKEAVSRAWRKVMRPTGRAGRLGTCRSSIEDISNPASNPA